VSLGRVREAAKRQEDDRKWLRNVDVEDFLNSMQISKWRRATADEILYSCPFPGHTHGDDTPSAYMNTGEKEPGKTTSWKCHGCGRQGTAVLFYAQVENVSKQEARRVLKAQYAPHYRAPKGGTIVAELDQRFAEPTRLRERAEKNPVIAFEEYERRFAVDWYESEQIDAPECRYLFERGFTADTLTAWDIGYDDLTRRLAIPIHNHLSQIVGIKGRAWREGVKPKYKILGDKGRSTAYGWPVYEKSRVVFGLHRCYRDEPLVLVEGELDVIALWQHGITAIATGSAHLSPVQQRLVRDHADEVTVWFDEGSAGDNATWGYHDKDGDFHPGIVQALEPHLNLRVVVDARPDDPARLVELQRGEEIDTLLANARPSFDLA
jgi:DNA primase